MAPLSYQLLLLLALLTVVKSRPTCNPEHTSPKTEGEEKVDSKFTCVPFAEVFSSSQEVVSSCQLKSSGEGTYDHVNSEGTSSASEFPSGIESFAKVGSSKIVSESNSIHSSPSSNTPNSLRGSKRCCNCPHCIKCGNWNSSKNCPSCAFCCNCGQLSTPATNAPNTTATNNTGTICDSIRNCWPPLTNYNQCQLPPCNGYGTLKSCVKGPINQVVPCPTGTVCDAYGNCWTPLTNSNPYQLPQCNRYGPLVSCVNRLINQVVPCPTGTICDAYGNCCTPGTHFNPYPPLQCSGLGTLAPPLTTTCPPTASTIGTVNDCTVTVNTPAPILCNSVCCAIGNGLYPGTSYNSYPYPQECRCGAEHPYLHPPPGAPRSGSFCDPCGTCGYPIPRACPYRYPICMKRSYCDTSYSSDSSSCDSSSSSSENSCDTSKSCALSRKKSTLNLLHHSRNICGHSSRPRTNSNFGTLPSKIVSSGTKPSSASSSNTSASDNICETPAGKSSHKYEFYCPNSIIYVNGGPLGDTGPSISNVKVNADPCSKHMPPKSNYEQSPVSNCVRGQKRKGDSDPYEPRSVYNMGPNADPWIKHGPPMSNYEPSPVSNCVRYQKRKGDSDSCEYRSVSHYEENPDPSITYAHPNPNYESGPVSNRIRCENRKGDSDPYDSRSLSNVGPNTDPWIKHGPPMLNYESGLLSDFVPSKKQRKGGSNSCESKSVSMSCYRKKKKGIKSYLISHISNNSGPSDNGSNFCDNISDNVFFPQINVSTKSMRPCSKVCSSSKFSSFSSKSKNSPSSESPSISDSASSDSSSISANSLNKQLRSSFAPKFKTSLSLQSSSSSESSSDSASSDSSSSSTSSLFESRRSSSSSSTSVESASDEQSSESFKSLNLAQNDSKQSSSDIKTTVLSKFFSKFESMGI